MSVGLRVYYIKAGALTEDYEYFEDVVDYQVTDGVLDIIVLVNTIKVAIRKYAPGVWTRVVVVDTEKLT